MTRLNKFVNTIQNIDHLQHELKSTSRLCINNFFTKKFSDDIYHSLDKGVNWDIAHYSNNKGHKLTFEEIKKTSDGEIKRKILEIQNCKPNEYQFLYHTYMIVTAYLEGRNPGHLLHYFLEFVNSQEFLSLIRQITGCKNIRKMDAQATYYAKGDFLREHNDADSVEGRRFAYVLNMTKNWTPDWGGILQFTKDDKIIESFVPSYNRLVIFEVPQNHLVSQVTSFAGEKRLSIAGWMYDQ